MPQIKKRNVNMKIWVILLMLMHRSFLTTYNLVHIHRHLHKRHMRDTLSVSHGMVHLMK